VSSQRAYLAKSSRRSWGLNTSLRSFPRLPRYRYGRSLETRFRQGYRPLLQGSHLASTLMRGVVLISMMPYIDYKPGRELLVPTSTVSQMLIFVTTDEWRSLQLCPRSMAMWIIQSGPCLAALGEPQGMSCPHRNQLTCRFGAADSRELLR
jgi:hypothetical protein